MGWMYLWEEGFVRETVAPSTGRRGVLAAQHLVRDLLDAVLERVERLADRRDRAVEPRADAERLEILRVLFERVDGVGHGGDVDVERVLALAVEVVRDVLVVLVVLREHGRGPEPAHVRDGDGHDEEHGEDE